MRQPPEMIQFTIGREKCDILLESPYVSERHARLIFDPKGPLSIVDEPSRNGTFLLNAGEAESRIGTSPVQVSLASVLRFADETLRVSDLVLQLLEHRTQARVQLATSWGGREADDLLQAYGGREHLREIIIIADQEPPTDKTRQDTKAKKLKIDPDTGRLIHD